MFDSVVCTMVFDKNECLVATKLVIKEEFKPDDVVELLQELQLNVGLGSFDIIKNIDIINDHAEFDVGEYTVCVVEDY